MDKVKAGEVTMEKTFSHLDAHVQEEILSKTIIFQGEKVTLRDLLTPTCNVDLDEIIDADLLSKLNNNEDISVGVAVNVLNEDVQSYYIHRSFSHNEQITEERSLCEYRESRWHQMVTVMNSPGSGKSTVLDNMAVTMKKNHPYLWVIKIDLRDYSEALSEFKENKGRLVSLIDLLNLRQESRIKEGLEQKIFSIHHKVVLFVDGIDEVSSNHISIIDDFMVDCYRTHNLAKVFVASSDYMDESLQAQLWSQCPLIQLSEENQILLFKRLLENEIVLTKNLEKFRIYAEELVKQKWFREDENTPVGVPLQIRMVAEVLCGIKNPDEEIADVWQGYYEFLSLDKGESSVAKKVNLAKLYLLYVHQSCCENKTKLNENFMREDMAKFIEKCEYSLYITALEEILTKKQCELFECYTNKVRKCSKETLPLKIVKKVGDHLRFSHRTMAEYFLADCIANELHLTENREFLKFFIETILTRKEFRLVRLFLDSLIGCVLNSVSDKTLESIGFIVTENNLPYLHHLLQEGCIDIFKFLFECMKRAGLHLDFDIVRLKGETLLQTAISAGHFDMMKFLVGQGACVKARDDNEQTALHRAVNKNNLSAVKFLVQHDVEINCRDVNGRTPLHEAAASGSLEMVEYLLSQGADVDCRDRQRLTPLHEAVKSGDINKVKYLVENNADVNSRAKSGTPLFDAVSEGHVDIVKYLLEIGAEVTFKNAGGSTVLHNRRKQHQVLSENMVEIFKLLIERGANINAIDRNGLTVLQSYMDSDDNINVVKFLLDSGVYLKRASKNVSVLSKMLRSGAIKIVEYLLEKDATFFSDHLIFIVLASGRLELIKYLMEKGIDLKFHTNQAYSALQAAVCRKDIDLVRLLIGKGVATHTKGTQMSLLQQAINNYCDFDTVKFLAENGAPLEGSVEEATRKGDLRLVKYLMEKGAKPGIIHNVGGNPELLQYLIENGINVNKQSVLNQSAYDGHVNVAKWLIEKGMSVNIDEYCWYTPLTQAAKYDHPHIVKLLFKNGARLEDTDWKRETALNKAFKHDHIEVAEFLAENGADIKRVIDEDRNCLIGSLHGRFRRINFVLKYSTSINVDIRPDSYVFALWLKYGAFEAAEYLVERSVGVCKSVPDTVSRLVEIGDSELLGFIFENSTTVKYLLEKGWKVDFGEFNKYNTLLNTAVLQDDLKFVKYLVEKVGVDVNKKDEHGNTALHKACDFGTIKYLVGKGADVNASTNNGWSVLHEAVAYKNFDICKFLVDSGADVNSQDKGGRTVLHVAAKNGSYAKLTYLLEKGAHFTSEEKCKVLHEVVRFNDFALLKCLVENGADIEGKDGDGRTVLYKVVENGDLETVKYLVGKEANVKAVDNKSVSLFEFASSKSDSNIVSFLKSMGARNRGKKK